MMYGLAKKANAPKSLVTDSPIKELAGVQGPHDEPCVWHQWPSYLRLGYQFRQALGETRAGRGHRG